MDAQLPTVPPFEMVVEEGKIREFAAATKSSNPDYQGSNASSPATFLASAILWSGPEHDPLTYVDRDYGRVLHGEQEFSFPAGPPRAGTRLTAQRTIERIYEKSGRRGGVMRFFEVRTTFHDSDGNLVAEARNTTIETSKAADG